jgi:hypothetical protein
MKNTELKLKLDKSLAHQTNEQVIAALEAVLAQPMQYHTIAINPASPAGLKVQLEQTYECSVRDGITGGCYGARDGSSAEGLTVWMHAKHLTDRCLTPDGDEMVNPWYLLNEYGKLFDGLDGETLEQLADELDLETKADNTYNFATDFGSPKNENAGFMFDFQFTTVETSKKFLVAVMFHCGGDPRGNYTDKLVWKFESADDFYSVILPYKLLTDSEAEEA